MYALHFLVVWLTLRELSALEIDAEHVNKIGHAVRHYGHWRHGLEATQVGNSDAGFLSEFTRGTGDGDSLSRLSLEQEIQECIVARAYLFQCAHGHHGAVRIERETAVGLEHAEDNGVALRRAGFRR